MSKKIQRYNSYTSCRLFHILERKLTYTTMKQSYIFLIFLIISFNSCFSQKKETIKIKEQYTPLKTYENDKNVKNESKKEVFSYNYKLSSKRDTIRYYNDTYDTQDKTIPVTFILSRNKQENNAITLLVDEEAKVFDSIVIRFTDQQQVVTINQNDMYFLNLSYYTELKKSIINENNMLDLVDLLDDGLGDYPYQLKYLNKITSYKKYKNLDFKILKAVIKTNRTQSDGKDMWNVTYKYNNDNTLQLVTKISTDGEFAFEKKLLSKNGTEYKYKVHNNVESKYEDNDEVTFDVNKNTYSIVQNHFQFGLVKEEISQIKRILFTQE
ncbi:hypothetical protein NZD88_11020 [Chryseobacterium antibioticum]|uniref:DUF4292 domain-containing protein n=1 Tax=Chryseobacterium pyrolae TaxID=2987481 RepID=A0ABT2IHE8_9FLAO|nr:hypothetical protein [Chryseobacterium pyrolae]MCT2408071.1 hypothetical protein [Chryseobacterium pyrolae]